MFKSLLTLNTRAETRAIPPLFDMLQSLEGTTLALQHYYDIVGVSRRLPLMTVYQADEQPFGHRVAVWMTEYSDKVSEKTTKRLDDALLKNRQIESPNVLRILDYGSTEGHAFLVTDALHAISLHAWLTANGPVAPWQALRLLDQLTAVVEAAHKAGFHSLGIQSNNIFISDPERFSIVLSPLGIGLTRAEIRELHDVAIVPDLVRHIPPWAYANAIKTSENPPTHQAFSKESALLGDADPSLSENSDISPKNTPTSLDTILHDEEDIQNLDDSVLSAIDADDFSDPLPPTGFCPDVYDVAAVIYESLCASHPYFSNDNDVAAAALELSQANPPELSRRVDIDENLSHAVMRFLREPKENDLPKFLSEFAAACPNSAKENARNAEKSWLKPEPQKPAAKRHKHLKMKSRFTLHAFALALVGILALTIFITYHVARIYRPIDLFAIPEILPQSQNGIDILFNPVTPIQGKADIYITSMADGSLIRLGQLPYIYRNQERGAKLNFVITNEEGKSTQVPVVVKSDGDFMIVQVAVP